MSSTIVITLDGPAGVGKSTLARLVAGAMKLPFLDTGAMFRCIAFKLGPAAEQMAAGDLSLALQNIHFALEGVGKDSILLCDGSAPGNEIRTEEIGGRASKLAALSVVRNFLKEAQQHLGQNFSLVAEGRDMGTVVFPQASCKFFLDADPAVRAIRRQKQLADQGRDEDLQVLEKQIRERDAQDRNRTIAPLKAAADAISIDTTDLSQDDVLVIMLETLQTRGLYNK